MTNRLLGAPIEALPLYAVLAVLHDWTAGMPANTCLGSSTVTIEALKQLGFEAELVSAYIEIHSVDDPYGPALGSIGRADGAAVASPDGRSIDGHVVVWASSFHRMVDGALIQQPLLRAAAEHDKLPIVSPQPDRSVLFTTRPAARRDPYLIVYNLFDGQLGQLAPALRGPTAEVFAYGGLSAAHTAVQVMQVLGGYRADMRVLHQRFPMLRDLLSGRRTLPPLPSEPEALQQLRREFPQFDRGEEP